MRFALAISAAALFPLAFTGCGGSSSAGSAPIADASSSIDASKYVLTEEPDGVVGVIAARQSAQDGDPIVVVGRIGGAASPWVKGRAAFTLLDASKSVVAEGTDSGDSEVCMGDCCALERAACTTLVKFVDDGGRVLAVDSRELLGVEANEMVVIRGKVSADESGNFTVLAEGVYVRR